MKKTKIRLSKLLSRTTISRKKSFFYLHSICISDKSSNKVCLKCLDKCTTRKTKTLPAFLLHLQKTNYQNSFYSVRLCSEMSEKYILKQVCTTFNMLSSSFDPDALWSITGKKTNHRKIIHKLTGASTNNRFLGTYKHFTFSRLKKTLLSKATYNEEGIKRFIVRRQYSHQLLLIQSFWF